MTNDPERTGDPSDMDSVEDEDDNRTSNITSQILRRPDVLAALQERFDAHKMEANIILLILFIKCRHSNVKNRV